MPNRLIEAALVIVLAAAAAGQLPRLMQTARIAELQLLKDSESSKWGRPFMLPVHHEQPKRTSKADRHPVR